MNRWIVWIVASLVTLCVVAILAFRWAAYHREALPFAAGLPDDGRLLETPEGSFFVLEAGEAGTPRVLFAHGTAAWSAIWRETMNAVSKSGYHSTAFDMPPFGWSEYPEGTDYSRSAQADRIVALLETLGDQPVVVAHSVGAGPVSEAVLQRPDLVSGFVIVAGAIGLNDRADPKQPPFVLRNPTIRPYLTSATATNPLLTRKFLQDFMYQADAASPEVVAMLQEPMVRENYTQVVSDWIPELFTTPNDALSLDPANWTSLDVPVALIWGTEDSVTPVFQGKELASLIPGATITVLTDVGHIPHLEAPAEFAAALIDALQPMTQSHKEEREQK
ncbi:alpha/beta fold hydrolase [Ruegeria halocynthiae]|uniref:alpha/beta fold hydrolase n=1 Tax=Ruegeria halocynthiae TaxID=985054 RepID=UPI000565C5FB|nr:alpha/beta hydrolase [Ruegeria halocynthiae]